MKMVFFTALKSIIGETIEEGYEPYSTHRPSEEIASVIAPGSILARMTPSILLTMFGNKVLVELKRKLQEIYTGKDWEPVKEGVEVLREANINIYTGKDKDGDNAYYTKDEIDAGALICTIYNNNSVNMIGLHIKPSTSPNCMLIGDNLVAFTKIHSNDELTISHELYDRIHHNKY